MVDSKEYFQLFEDHLKLKKQIREMLDRFTLFGKYTEHDKDCALGDIREIVG